LEKKLPSAADLISAGEKEKDGRSSAKDPFLSDQKGELARWASARRKGKERKMLTSSKFGIRKKGRGVYTSVSRPRKARYKLGPFPEEKREKEKPVEG